MFLVCKALELQNRRTFQNIVCDVAGALGKLRVCVDASTSTDCLQILSKSSCYLNGFILVRLSW